MHDHDAAGPGISLDVVLAAPFVLMLTLYAAGIVIQARRGRAWPWHRSAAWVAGVIAAALGFVGPFARAAHGDFVAHMWAHLLVGMLAPLLLALGAPISLALRSLHVTPARRLSRVLRSWPARVMSAPVVAASLVVAGMWALYATALYDAMQQNILIHWLVMVHFLVSGYLFTASIVLVDPAPHGAGFRTRAAVVVLAFAAHSILAKSLYAAPPAGVDVAAAQVGSQLMYYGGDLIDAAIITALCAQWYRRAGRRLARTPQDFGLAAGRHHTLVNSGSRVRRALKAKTVFTTRSTSSKSGLRPS